MKKFFLFLIISSFLFSMPIAHGALCKKNFLLSIKMDEDWYQKEKMRLVREEILLQENSRYISKQSKPLISEPYRCQKKEECDPLKNCQMEKDVSNISEEEYLIKIDSGIFIAKSYCSVIGKCIGYNDFTHNLKVTAAEDRLIDIRKDNALFYHYFYSANSNNYEPLFNMTNFHSGKELYLNDMPHFSPDDKIMVEVRSVPKQEVESDFPTGYNINIYEANQLGEYENIEPAELDLQDGNKVISTFLTRNPACGETPHFHSWVGNREVLLSSLPVNEDNGGKKVVLFYDKKAKKWACRDSQIFEYKCKSYLPGSVKYSSNLAAEQLGDCK